MQNYNPDYFNYRGCPDNYGGYPIPQPFEGYAGAPGVNPAFPEAFAGGPGANKGFPEAFAGSPAANPVFPEAFAGVPGADKGFPGAFAGSPAANPGFPGAFAGCPGSGDCFPGFFDTLPFDYLPVAGRYCNEQLTRIIQECQATCEYLTTHLKGRCDCRSRRKQLIILRDCADICGTNSKFVPRGSDFDRQTVLICAQICECCAKECARFSDKLSQQCAKVCLFTAQACRAYAGFGF